MLFSQSHLSDNPSGGRKRTGFAPEIDREWISPERPGSLVPVFRPPRPQEYEYGEPKPCLEKPRDVVVDARKATAGYQPRSVRWWPVRSSVAVKCRGLQGAGRFT